MSRDCINVSNAIWDFVREGVELTEKELAHASSCSSCAAAFAEARASVPAFDRVKPIPAAPDCRSAVMNRIMPRRRFLLVWSYACAAVIVLAAVVCVALHPQSEGVMRHVVRKPATVAVDLSAKVSPLSPEPTAAAKTEKPRLSRLAVDTSTALSRVEPPRHKHNPRSTRPSRQTQPFPDVEVPIPPTAAPDETLALASVTWSIANQPKNSYRDSYTLTDSTTGEVVKCSVKRDGNTIEIDMESEPAEPESKPEPLRESNSNEAIRCS